MGTVKPPPDRLAKKLKLLFQRDHDIWVVHQQANRTHRRSVAHRLLALESVDYSQASLIVWWWNWAAALVQATVQVDVNVKNKHRPEFTLCRRGITTIHEPQMVAIRLARLVLRLLVLSGSSLFPTTPFLVLQPYHLLIRNLGTPWFTKFQLVTDIGFGLVEFRQSRVFFQHRKNSNRQVNVLCQLAELHQTQLFQLVHGFHPLS